MNTVICMQRASHIARIGWLIPSAQKTLEGGAPMARTQRICHLIYCVRANSQYLVYVYRALEPILMYIQNGGAVGACLMLHTNETVCTKSKHVSLLLEQVSIAKCCTITTRQAHQSQMLVVSTRHLHCILLHIPHCGDFLWKHKSSRECILSRLRFERLRGNNAFDHRFALLLCKMCTYCGHT